MTRTVQYKPRSWHDYNKALIQRGSLCLWINDAVLSEWEAPVHAQRGAPRQYSDLRPSAPSLTIDPAAPI